MKMKTNEDFIKELSALDNGIIALDKYIGNKKKIRFQCRNGHIWSARPYNILTGGGCPFCCGQRAIVGQTDLWTTRPDIARLLLNPEDGYKYMAHSNCKVDFVCPTCHTILKKDINHISYRGLRCDVCGDGVSYPNKFSRALLKQLDVNNLSFEWQPEWLKPYFYDNYFEYNNHRYVLEMDGSVGHGNTLFNSNQRDIIGDKIDCYKDNLAKNHDIMVIRIDCQYTDGLRFDYIKNAILKSDLSRIINLSDIDWIKCDKMALHSLVYDVAALYNNNFSVAEISNDIGYSKNSVRNWLKQATNVGLCHYDKHESKKRGYRNICKPINQYDANGVYVATYDSITIAASSVDLKSSSTITVHIKDRNKHKTAGGFVWYYADDAAQPDESKVITKQND